MNIQEETIGVAPVGCAVFAYDYMNIDMQEAAHRTRKCVATESSVSSQINMFFLIKGDGDLAAIGTGETFIQ